MSSVLLETLTLHVCRFDPVLDVTELVAQSCCWVCTTGSTLIKEFLSGRLVL